MGLCQGKRRLSHGLRRLVRRTKAGAPKLLQPTRPATNRPGLAANTQRNATVAVATGIANGQERIAAGRRAIASAARLIARAQVASIMSESSAARDPSRPARAVNAHFRSRAQ